MAKRSTPKGGADTEQRDDIDLDFDRESSLRIGKGQSGRSGKLTFKGFRQIMKIAQDGRKSLGAGQRKRPNSRVLPPRPTKATALRQRVSVRMTYTRNKNPGQWGAHGRYIERESATGPNDIGRGFDADNDSVGVASKLEAWQAQNDPNLFKLILSPEHGDRLALKDYTREYMAELEKTLGKPLEWVAADHYNTDHPHVHVALRGVDKKGRALVIPREVVKGALRDIAQDLATNRLGHRTALDVAEERDKQVTQQRFTDLDRLLTKTGRVQPDGSRVIDLSEALDARASDAKKELRLQLLRRLSVLESMGLAQRQQGRVFRLEGATERILRDHQIAGDRLKTLHAHRAMVSDPRMQLVPMPKTETRFTGRLIGTGLDDSAGQSYMLVESTSGRVHYIYQTPGTEKARREGLRAGDAVNVVQREFTGRDGKPRMSLQLASLGEADALTTNPKALQREVRAFVRDHGQLPGELSLGGWVGRYRSAVHQEAERMLQRGEIQQQAGRFIVTPTRPRDRGRP